MVSVSQFTTHLEARNGVVKIALRGELDVATVPILRDHLLQVDSDGAGGIMLDLRDLTFLDSSGLQALLKARDHAERHGHRLFLIGVSSSMRRLFEITRTEFLLDDQAAVGVLARFTGGQPRTVDPTTDLSDDTDADA
jgi:anti-anti-sigma factor